MERKPNAASFFDRVYVVVKLIPKGKVATYGQVAAILEHPRAARTVGWALHGLPERLAACVPWHRVINAQGRISNTSGRKFSRLPHRRARGGKPRAGGAEEQLRRLKKEGIKFDKTGRCDLRKCLWEPPLRLR
jgi:methylated-DNA-protein-cysteine methyltransferase-like protein